MDFSSRFKKVREHFGISQKEIADLLEVSQKSVSFWESGRNEPQISVLRRMYELYLINPIWLLIGNGKMILDKSDNIDISTHNSYYYKNDSELASYLGVANTQKLSQQEVEIVQGYRALDKDDQEIFYYELKTAALKAKKKKGMEIN